MERVVFYSWLTGRPNSTNRGFIEAALEKAAKAISSDDSIKIEPRIEQGAQGLGGTHDIAATILARIDKCDAFVCDMSFIGQFGERFIPNPNVLLELGYAIKTKGWARIVIVFNKAYGRIEELPFDVRGKTVVSYIAQEEQAERSAEKNRLAGALEEHFHHILQLEQPGADPIEHVTKLIDSESYATLRSFVKKQADPVIRALTADRFNVNQKGCDAEFASRVHDYDKLCLPIARLLAAGCASESQQEIWVDLVERFGNAYESFAPDGINWWREMRAYPGILAFSAAGVCYVAAHRYDRLARLLKETAYHEYSPTRSHESATNRVQLARYLYTEQFRQQRRWGEQSKCDLRTGMSDCVAEKLSVALHEVIPQMNKFDFAFDKFEFLTCLHLFANSTDGFGPRAPYGAFLRKRRFQASMGNELKKEVNDSGGVNSPIIRARIAGNDNTDFIRFVTEYETWLNENTRSMMF